MTACSGNSDVTGAFISGEARFPSVCRTVSAHAGGLQDTGGSSKEKNLVDFLVLYIVCG